MLFVSDRKIYVIGADGKSTALGSIPVEVPIPGLRPRSLQVNDGLVFVYGLTELPMLVDLAKKHVVLASGYRFERDGPILGAGGTL